MEAELFPHNQRAYSIRYLDNQRDMADELFDGCIASEMTLGDAIGRGILPAPKYVVSLYSCQEELERYRRRVQRVNGAARQAADKDLDALRWALDRAEGLDVIFRRHMTDLHGKYLVFCANQEHLQEMLEKWISVQRKAGREGKLTAEQAQRVSAIGMRWQSAQEMQWNRMYACAAQYVRDHEGIEKLLKDENQPQLRLWYRRQERKRRDGKLSAA